jgi:hypothetical protein
MYQQIVLALLLTGCGKSTNGVTELPMMNKECSVVIGDYPNECFKCFPSPANSIICRSERRECAIQSNGQWGCYTWPMKPQPLEDMDYEIINY